MWMTSSTVMDCCLAELQAIQRKAIEARMMTKHSGGLGNIVGELVCEANEEEAKLLSYLIET